MDHGVYQSGTCIDGRFVIVRYIGHGATSDVYEAQDQRSGLHVAVKIMNHSRLRDPEAQARFHREAEVQEMIDHDNVARLHGDGVTAANQPYLVVELFSGRCLRTVLNEVTRVHPLHAASYTWQALTGLSACHAAGVRHRDLKPDNMMLKPSPGPVERVALIDFGFASLQGGARLTREGFVVGSLSYIAPERLRGMAGDERSDIYGLGIVFYELLTGRPPFQAESELALARKHIEEQPAALARAVPGLSIPPQLEAVVFHALEKNPAARPQSALAITTALEEAAQHV